MSLQTGLSPLPSLKSSRLSTTTWPIRSCLENRSKSYTEKCSFLECSSFSGTPNWNVSLNTGFRVFLWTWRRRRRPELVICPSYSVFLSDNLADLMCRHLWCFVLPNYFCAESCCVCWDISSLDFLWLMFVVLHFSLPVCPACLLLGFLALS